MEKEGKTVDNEFDPTKEQIASAIEVLSLRDKLYTSVFADGEGDDLDLQTLLGAVGMFLGLAIGEDEDTEEESEAIIEAMVKMIKEGYLTQAAENTLS
ncbi:MAG: hypothetical protein ACI9S8_000177 [Chlamydiales bacterium]|jgi:hypothetical protein